MAPAAETWHAGSNQPPPVDPDSILRIGLGAWAGILVAFVLAAIAVRLLAPGPRARRRWKRDRGPLVDGELVDVTGVVRALGAPLVAPLSGTACVGHESRARVFGGPASADVVAAPHARALAPFVLETRRGDVIVDAGDALLEGTSARLAGARRSTARELAFLAEHGVPSPQHEHAYFDELVLRVGGLATVRGVLAIDSDPHAPGERGYRDSAPRRYRVVAPARRRVVIEPGE